MDTEA